MLQKLRKISLIASVLGLILNTERVSCQVEGIGFDFIPNTCVRSFVDEWVKTNDQESFDMARRLIKEEGLLVGGSSGSAVAGAIKYALKHNLNENHRIVIILPDSVRNYVNKFLCDDWMIEKRFLPRDLYLNKESKVYGRKPRDVTLQAVRAYDKNLTVGLAFDLFENGAEMIPIVENNQVKGVLYANKFIATVQAKKLKDTDTIERCISKDFVVVR